MALFAYFKRIGQVAYRLQLPKGTRIHPVFHVSFLKKKLGNLVTPMGELPSFTEDGIIKEEPIAVLDRRLVKRRNQAVPEVSVQWSNMAPEDATWEVWQSLHEQFPGAKLEDKVQP